MSVLHRENKSSHWARQTVRRMPHGAFSEARLSAFFNITELKRAEIASTARNGHSANGCGDCESR
jgi:hypothetical protein